MLERITPGVQRAYPAQSEAAHALHNRGTGAVLALAFQTREQARAPNNSVNSTGFAARVGFGIGLQQLARIHRRIDLGGGKRGVAQQFLQ